MQKKMYQLTDEVLDLQRRENESDPGAQLWLEEIEVMKEKMESIPKGEIGCFNLAKRYKAGKISYTFIEEMEALDKKKPEIKKKQQPLASILEPDGSPGSRDFIFKMALESLLSNSESEKMIALWGMSGIGKTTMIEQLKKAVEDSKIFDWVVKVFLGGLKDILSIQQHMAKSIGHYLDDTTIDGRADRLRKIFLEMSQEGEKKVLVIMDDIQMKIDLKYVGLTSPLPNAFKLLFTSQSQDTCDKMGVKAHSIFEVHGLDENEVETSFSKIVGQPLSEGDDPNKVREYIVKECHGLPIALKTIAINLRDKNKEEWKDTLSDLRQNDLQDLQDCVHKVFDISYNDLKMKDKEIFVLCGLFPIHFDIPIEDLLIYGWGLELFTNVETLLEARRQIDNCVHNLIHANFLLDSEIKGCVKMHDLLRVFALSKLSELKRASVVKDDNMLGQQLTKDANDSYDRILLKCNGMSEFPLDYMKHENLSLLILMGENTFVKFPKDLYERLERLKVVSYQNMHIPMLPVTYKHSINLRTLYLRSCSLIDDDICSLGSLCNLEILSFLQCKFSRLPSTIGKLVKLKLLNLTGCQLLCIDNGVFQNLNSLEEFYMRDYNKTATMLTNANCKELEILLSRRLVALEMEFLEKRTLLKNTSFGNLKRFRISIGCKLERVERYSFRNTLKLIIDREGLLKCNINELFDKTEDLTLRVSGMSNINELLDKTKDLTLQVSGMIRLQDVSTHHSFSNLRDLHVSECTHLTCLFKFSMASSLNKLERLTISDCPILSALFCEASEDVVIIFEKLKYMSLQRLPNMECLCDNVLQLPEMVELILDGLPYFTSIYPDNDIQSLLNEKVVIPKLEKLSISRMENLKQIWPSTISTTFMLREIRVSRCPSLVNLFPDNLWPIMKHLEELKVEKCRSIEVLFNIDDEYVSGTREDSRLRTIEVSDLDKLKELWRMKAVNKPDIRINNFKGVKSIEIRDCKRFTNLFTPTTANFDLSSLTNYTTIGIGGDLDGRDQTKDEIDSEQEIKFDDPCYPLRTFHNLQQLKLQGDERVGNEVFKMDSQPHLLHPHLKLLKLIDLNKMSHVWSCNWNKFSIPQPQPLQFPFQSLTHIYLHHCHKITYLFSPLMAKCLSNLKCVDMYICHGIEEVVSSRDDESEKNIASTSSDISTTTFFPHLDIFKVNYLQSLNRIGGGETLSSGQKHISGIPSSNIFAQSAQETSWLFCQHAKHITIEKCDALISLIPRYAVNQMQRLEELIINDCGTMIEVFESGPINKSSTVDDGSAHGITSTSTSPTLNIVSLVPRLTNLKSVSICKCDLLPHIFTFSTLESLKQLEVLRIKRCKAIQVIIKEENDGTPSSEVGFRRLHTLELDHLPNLNAFFLGMNEFRWPSLDNVTINECPQLTVFTAGSSRTPNLKYVSTSLGVHSLEHDLNFQGASSTSSSDPAISETLSFHNLIEINKKHANVETVIPSNALKILKKLEKIRLTNSYWVEEVFGVEMRVANDDGYNESQTVVEIPNLREVYLYSLRAIKHLFKNNNQLTVLGFPNLTTLSIYDCTRLEHVFTSSMVGSLVHLQDLHISACVSLQLIVKEDEELDAKVIKLPRLKSLKLHDLPILKGFCLGKQDFLWPSLDTLQINRCPKITDFTKGHSDAPELKVIDITFGMCYVKEDINLLIKTKQKEVQDVLSMLQKEREVFEQMKSE